ncbi:nucleotidyltransferase family protein [Paenibacillus macerans]|uniref:nucleotidyltransferase family protein n=1 Tax=Paenibacillus macerans TaxID=44252 RepID=UPI003D3132DC
MRIAGIYLAAGLGSRMGGSKVSRKLSPGVAFGSVALVELEACGLEPLVVVVRAGDMLEWLPPASGTPGARRTATCLTAHLGLSFSLRCGLNAVIPYDPDAVVVALADQPFVTAELVDRMSEAFRRSPELDYVACSDGEEAMPPALFSKALFPALQQLDGDRGAAGILRSSAYKGLTLRPESSLFAMDADTEAEFREVQNMWLRQQPSSEQIG